MSASEFTPLTMISKSRGHVSVISLDSFHLSYSTRIRVNCLAKSIALDFEEGKFNLLLLAALQGRQEVVTCTSTHVVDICLRFRMRRHVVPAFVRLNIQHIRNIGGMLFMYIISRAKVTCNH